MTCIDAAVCLFFFPFKCDPFFFFIYLNFIGFYSWIAVLFFVFFKCRQFNCQEIICVFQMWICRAARKEMRLISGYSLPFSFHCDLLRPPLTTVYLFTGIQELICIGIRWSTRRPEIVRQEVLVEFLLAWTWIQSVAIQRCSKVFTIRCQRHSEMTSVTTSVKS